MENKVIEEIVGTNENYQIVLNVYASSRDEMFFVYKYKSENKEEKTELKKCVTYIDCIEYIETREKRIGNVKKKKIEPLDCFTDDFKKAKITSLADNNSFWYSVNGIRSKSYGMLEILKYNSINEKLIEEIGKLDKQIESKKKLLEYFTKDEIREYFKD